MIAKSVLNQAAAGLVGLCLALFPVSAIAQTSPKATVVAFGLFDHSVFEKEAKGAARILANRFGGGQVIVRANAKGRADATVKTLAATLRSAGAEMDAENDLLLLVLTSHGSPVGLAVKAGSQQETLSPSNLASMLNRAGVRHRVVIISACYSGIFIRSLANADTLVITAADADHPSFGCQDGAEWTYFGDAFFNTALRRTSNLKDAFALARVLVRKRELRARLTPSNPQMAGGENIERLLKGNPASSSMRTELSPAASRPRVHSQ